MVRAGYKQTELGVIPEEWEVLLLKNIVDFYDNHRRPIKSSERKPGSFPYYGASGIIDYVNDYIFDGEYILLGEDGENILSRNLPLVYYSNGKVWINNHAHVLKCKDLVLPFFLLNKLESLDYSSLNSGTAQPKLNKENCSNILVPLPPLKEQEAIAEALSDTDKWISSLEELIAKKRLIKQGAMQELLTPKEDWEVKTLGEVIDVYRGGSPRPIQDYITDKSTGVNWIKIGDTSATGKYIVNANEKIIPEGEKSSRRVFKGDFLLSNSMSFGRPYILKIDGCIHDGWLVLQNYQNSFYTEFLYYLLTSKYIIDQYKSKAAGSSVLNLNKELVSSVSLIIPSLEEQERIATILSDMDMEIEQLEVQLVKAKDIKQGMMQELLTGRVRLV